MIMVSSLFFRSLMAYHFHYRHYLHSTSLKSRCLTFKHFKVANLAYSFRLQLPRCRLIHNAGIRLNQNKTKLKQENNNRQDRENHNNPPCGHNCETVCVRVECSCHHDNASTASTEYAAIPVPPPRPHHQSMMRRLSKKVSLSLHPNSASSTGTPLLSSPGANNPKSANGQQTFDYMDLSGETTPSDSANTSTPVHSTTYRLYTDIGM